MAGCAEGAAVGSSHMIAVAPDPCSPSAAFGINGAAHIKQLRPEHGRYQPAVAPHSLPTVAEAVAAPSAIPAAAAAAAASDLPPPDAVGLAGDVGVSLGDNHALKPPVSKMQLWRSLICAQL